MTNQLQFSFFFLFTSININEMLQLLTFGAMQTLKYVLDY